MSICCLPSDLLGYLAAFAGCDYISDLRLPAFRKQIHAALTQISPEQFPTAQWQEAARYLLSDPPPAEETSDRILRRLLDATA